MAAPSYTMQRMSDVTSHRHSTSNSANHARTSTPAPVYAPVPANPYYKQFEKDWESYTAPKQQIQQAASQIMPMYQARLGGLQGPVAEAMRNRGQEQIQSQYGTALRSAANQAAAQGLRGPAAIAMQQDIRDQMGRATAGYQRDLTIADWDAKRQALADYYQTMGGERGILIGTPLAMQQLQNIQKGFNQYQNSLAGM